MTQNRISCQLGIGCVSILAALCLSSCSRNADYYLKRGSAFAKGDKYADAELEFRKAIQKDPRAGDAYFQLALTEERLGNGNEAYAALVQAERLLPKRADIKRELGDLALATYLTDPRHPQSLYDQLSRISRELLILDPRSFDGLRFEADLAMQDGKLEQASELFRKANAIRPMDPNVVGSWVDTLIKSGRPADGEELARELIQKHPEFGPIYDVLYARYMATNRTAEGESLLKLKGRNNPKDSGPLLQLAAYYRRVGRPADEARTLQALIDNPAVFPQAHALVGDYYAGLRNWDGAMREYDEGLQPSAKDRLLYQKKIANIFIAEGKLQQALAILDEGLKDHPNDLGARAVRADLLVGQGTPESLQKAISEFEDLVKQLPADEVLWFNLGRAYMAEGDYGTATARLTEAVRRNSRYIAPLVWLAAIGQRTRNYQGTIHYAEQILALDPRNTAGTLWHAIGLMGAGSYDQARLELNRVLQVSPDSKDAELQLGILNILQENYKQAQDIFRKLYAADPADSRVLRGYVETFAAQDQIDSALKILETDLAKSPNSADLHQITALTAARAGKFDIAIAQYKWLIAQQPKDASAYIGLGRVYRIAGQKDKASEILQKLLVADPKNTSAVAELAYIEASNGSNDSALYNYRRQLQLQPGDPVALNNLAYLLADTGKNLDEALSLAQQAREKLPDNPAISDTLAWVYIKHNMNDPAIQVLTYLVKKFPHEASYRYHLGLALLQKGEKPKAKSEFEGALSERPSPDIAEKIKEALAKVS